MVHVFVSSVVDAPLDKVWNVVRDFNALPDWHPAIAESYIEDGCEGNAVGCIRNFKLQDGSVIREQLLMMSDIEHSFSYSILESELGLIDYVAKFYLIPVTDDDNTCVVWLAEFRTDPGQEKDKEEMVAQGVFQYGIDALKKKLNRK